MTALVRTRRLWLADARTHRAGCVSAALWLTRAHESARANHTALPLSVGATIAHKLVPEHCAPFRGDLVRVRGTRDDCVVVARMPALRTSRAIRKFSWVPHMRNKVPATAGAFVLHNSTQAILAAPPVHFCSATHA